MQRVKAQAGATGRLPTLQQNKFALNATGADTWRLEMTTHDRGKIIAAAKEASFSAIQFDAMFYDAGPYDITEPTYQTELFYAIAFEAGRQAEREECYALKDAAMEIFNANSLGVSQETRDVIEWFSSSIRARGDMK